MNSLIDDWNAAIEPMTCVIKEHNEQIQRDYEQNKLHPETVLSALLPLPKKVKYPSSAWLRWWKGAWGWTLLARSADEQSWLPYGHPDMEQARSETRKLFSEHNVHPFLLLNYDQVWRNAWSLQKVPLMFKRRSQAGTRAQIQKRDPRMDKKIHAIKGARRSLTVS